MSNKEETTEAPFGPLPLGEEQLGDLRRASEERINDLELVTESTVDIAAQLLGLFLKERREQIEKNLAPDGVASQSPKLQETLGAEYDLLHMAYEKIKRWGDARVTLKAELLLRLTS